MKLEEITIKQNEVIVLGFPLGFAPTARDLELAVEGEPIRNLSPLNGRQLRICDPKGLSWLVDLNLNLVLWLDILLAKSRKRVQVDNDANDLFQGKIHIGQYTIQGPFSFEMGEIIRKVEMPRLVVNLVPDEKRIRALTVAFVENERLSDG